LDSAVRPGVHLHPDLRFLGLVGLSCLAPLAFLSSLRERTAPLNRARFFLFDRERSFFHTLSSSPPGRARACTFEMSKIFCLFFWISLLREENEVGCGFLLFVPALSVVRPGAKPSARFLPSHFFPSYTEAPPPRSPPTSLHQATRFCMIISLFRSVC